MIYVFIEKGTIRFYDKFSAKRYRDDGMCQHMWGEGGCGLNGKTLLSMMDEFSEWVKGINERIEDTEALDELDAIHDEDLVRCFLAENNFIPVNENLFYKK